MTRLGVLSDSHIHSPTQSLPCRLLEDFQSVDLILHAGDWVDLCVLDQLRPLAEVVGVAGNMDGAEIRSTFPVTNDLCISGYRIGLTHGWGGPSGIEDRILRRFQEVPDLIVFGHTHRSLFRKDGNLYFFNPGCARDVTSPYASTYGIITLGETIEARIVSAG